MKKTIAILTSLCLLGCSVPISERAERSLTADAYSQDYTVNSLIFRLDPDDPFSSVILKGVDNSVRDDLTSIKIPDEVMGLHVETISDSALANCKNLESVSIPDTVKNIEKSAFVGCPKLKSITIPDSVTSIGSGAFSGTGLESITIPDSVKSIGPIAFANCSSLKSVTLSESLSAIESFSFLECTALEEVNIPGSVKTIGQKAFESCYHLKNITIPDSVETIEDTAFMRCYSLTDVKLPSSVEKIGYLSFCQCTALRSISFYNPDCVIGDEGENAITEAGRKYDNLEFQNSCTLNNTTVIDEDNHILYGVYSGTINGFDNSTAQEFAEKYGYEFAPIQTTTTVTTKVTTTTTTVTTTKASTTTAKPMPGEDKDPIIIIPGIMGSRLFSDPSALSEYQIWDPKKDLSITGLDENMKAGNELYVRSPYLDQNELDEQIREYGALDHLKVTKKDLDSYDSGLYGDLGIVDRLCKEFPDRPVHVFSYDWRKSNTENAEELKSFLDTLLFMNTINGPSYNKVDIVAHSMGGLLTSKYVSLYGTDRIDKIITCGTPYEGAPHLFEAVEQGAITGDGLRDFALKYAGGLKRNTIAEFAGVTELLPSYKYCEENPMSLVQGETGRVRLDGSQDINNDEYLELIQDEFGQQAASSAFSFQNSIRDQSGYNALLNYENAYFFLGQKRKTVKKVWLRREDGDSVLIGDNYSHPYSIEAIEYTGNGDGTVPYYSASMCGQTLGLDVKHQFSVNSNHMDLMKNLDVLIDVCRILNNQTTIPHPFENTDPYEVITIECPVDVEIGSGNDRLCSSPDSLSLESSFGRLDIFGENNDKKALCIDEDTNLDIDLTGTDTGTMDFSIRHYSGEDELLDQRVFENVPLTDKTIIKTKADNTEVTVLNVDIDGDGVVDETWTAKKNETVTAPDENINSTTTSAATTTDNTVTTAAATTTTPADKPVYKLGDVNADGYIDSADASDILAEYARTSTGEAPTFKNDLFIAADVNYDDSVDSSDASDVLSYYAYTATGGNLPIEKFLSAAEHT